MKRFLSWCLAWIVALVLACPVGASAGQGPSLCSGVEINSKYVWRGMVVVDDWVVQPWMEVATGGFSLNLWGNYEPTDETGHRRRFTEVDLSAQYAFSLNRASVALGAIHYLFPNTSTPATTEVFAALSWDAAVSPGVSVYYDMDQAAGGVYASAEAEFSRPLPGPGSPSVQLSAGVGWANSEWLRCYYGLESSGMSDWHAKVALAFGLRVGSAQLTITPSVSYTSLIKSELRDSAEHPDNTILGLAVAVEL